MKIKEVKVVYCQRGAFDCDTTGKLFFFIMVASKDANESVRTSQLGMFGNVIEVKQFINDFHEQDAVRLLDQIDQLTIFANNSDKLADLNVIFETRAQLRAVETFDAQNYWQDTTQRARERAVAATQWASSLG